MFTLKLLYEAVANVAERGYVDFHSKNLPTGPSMNLEAFLGSDSLNPYETQPEAPKPQTPKRREDALPQLGESYQKL